MSQRLFHKLIEPLAILPPQTVGRQFIMQSPEMRLVLAVLHDAVRVITQDPRDLRANWRSF
jgi:hypothetical protein